MSNKLLAGTAVLLAAVTVISVAAAASRNRTETQVPASAAERLEESPASAAERLTASPVSDAVRITLDGSRISGASGSVKVSGSVATVTAAGTYQVSGALDNGYLVVDAGKEDTVQLLLDNASITSETFAALYVKQAGKVVVTLADGSKNALSNGGTFETIDANKVDGVIFSKDDLTLNGNGTLTIGASGKHGVVCKDDLSVISGTYDIAASGHALSAKNSVNIAGGTLRLTAGKDAIQAEHDDDKTKGNIYLAGGNVTLTAEDDGLNASGSVLVNGGNVSMRVAGDGIHADASVAISGGTVAIPACKEGIEGATIVISDGLVSLTSSDDGLNATAGISENRAIRGQGGFDANSSATPKASASVTLMPVDADTETGSASVAALTISGGEVHVNAEGDGLDSNGDLLISGGVVYVSGPTRNGNGALDYNGKGSITGGVLIATGPAGMGQNQNFDASSTQGAVMVTTGSQKAGSVITLTDKDGTELLRWTAEKDFGCVNISCPGLVQGGTYVLTAGSYTETISMQSLIYGAGAGEGFGRNFRNGTAGGQNPENGQIPDGAAPGNGQIRGGKRHGRPGTGTGTGSTPTAPTVVPSGDMI